MSFTWPLGLLSGLTVPLVLGAYLLALRRRRRQAVHYSSLALLRTALPRRRHWCRHLPVALLVVGLALLAVAFGRPQFTSDVPVAKTSIILALDESGSMCSTDVKPNRLGAAQRAARQFVDGQPGGVRVGLVLFSGFAELAVAPTTNRTTLDRALDDLGPYGGTAIGAAILKSLDAISEVDPQVPPVGNAVSRAAAAPSGAPSSASGSTGPGNAAATRPGTRGYVPDVVVLLTDGSNTQGVSPLDAVPYAVARRVRVYTIGLGTSHPGPLECSASQRGGDTGPGKFPYGGHGLGGGAPGGGRFGGALGNRSPLVADLPLLREVSRRTGGASYSAQDASQLEKVFATLPRDIGVQQERHEATVLFAAAAALVTLAALGAAIKWSPYP
ncbi:MAG TPA: VWA domain-containing protein [Acidimicrobiales bacterium]